MFASGKMEISNSSQVLLGAVTAITVYFIYVQARETRRQAELTGKHARLQAEIMLKFCTLYVKARPVTLAIDSLDILKERKMQCNIVQYLDRVSYIRSLIDLLETYASILEIKDNHINELISRRQDLDRLEKLLEKLMKKCKDYHEKNLIGTSEGSLHMENDSEISYIKNELIRIALSIDKAIFNSIKHNILPFRCYNLVKKGQESQR